MSAFQERLKNIVNRTTSEHIIKTAGVNNNNIEINNPDTEGLVKLAEVIRSIDIEPSYEDLYAFVGGLHGKR